jgi:hypothetical protein
MKVLPCIIFAFFWPVAMWLIATSVVSFVGWNNYFVIGLGEWNNLSRFGFMIFWFVGIGIFMEISYG